MPAPRLPALALALVAPGHGAAADGAAAPLPTIWEVGRHAGHVDVIDALPSPSEFHREYVVKQRPALFRAAARQMPAYSLWTDDYLRDRYGSVVMDQVETEKKETRTAFPKEDWTLSKFLDHYNSSDIYSTASTPKGLSDEVYMLPPINCGGFLKRLSQSVLWFSSGSTKSVIHKDGQENLHCMIAGEKRWILWGADSGIDSERMGWIQGEKEAERDPVFKNAYGAYVGRIDVDGVDLARFPRWGDLSWWDMTLRAGDCAYIPKAWYHYVEAPPQRSISFHVWFHARKVFDSKSCEALERKGYDLSSLLIRLSDCTWGFGEDDNMKPTTCKARKSSSTGASQRQASGAKSEL